MVSAPESLRTTYRPDVDGLRAMAVNHFQQSLLRGGFPDVDVFLSFRDSCYVVPD
jgi:hypothetical protein